MKLSLTFAIVSVLFSVHTMETAPLGKHEPSDILAVCRTYCDKRLYAWTENQLRMCIKAAAQCKEPGVLEDLLKNHIKALGHGYRIEQVTKIMPNLVVTCSVDDHVDVLRVLLKYHELTFDTLKAAFIRAAASGAFMAVDVLADRTEGIHTFIGTEAIIEAFNAEQYPMCRRLLTMLKVQHDADNSRIIMIKEKVFEPIDKEYQSDTMKNVMEAKKQPDVQPEDNLDEWDKSITSSGPVQSGWSFWGAFSSLSQMVSDACYRVYNGIPAFITYDKKEVEEFFEEARQNQ